jgi:2-polyprenyl-3-methyl-5-hydroxy-6-metoxy-1,4-benzoquinol methylase
MKLLLKMQIKRIDSLREIFGTLDGGQVLDVACGEGQFIEILQATLRSWKLITGLDMYHDLRVVLDKILGAIQ